MSLSIRNCLNFWYQKNLSCSGRFLGYIMVINDNNDQYAKSVEIFVLQKILFKLYVTRTINRYGFIWKSKTMEGSIFPVF